MNPLWIAILACLQFSQLSRAASDARAPWTEAGFENVEIREISGDELLPTSTHELHLTLVLFRGSSWTTQAVETKYLRAAKIYRQCGIRFAGAKLVIADVPKSVNGGSTLITDQMDKTVEDHADAQLAAMAPPEEMRPAVFFVDRVSSGVAAYSRGIRANVRAKPVPPALFDTAWMTTKTIADWYISFRPANYEPLAHELGHILGRFERHLSGVFGNVMSDDIKSLGDSFTPEQCETFRKNPLVMPVSPPQANRG